eukprot:8064644-Pyramimonas_sp.AAC.2
MHFPKCNPSPIAPARRQSLSKSGGKWVKILASQNLKSPAHPESLKPKGLAEFSQPHTGSKERANRSIDAGRPWRTPRPTENWTNTTPQKWARAVLSS